VTVFSRPDVVPQPGHQGQVVGIAAQEIHGGVGVQVYKAGHQRVAGQADMAGG
jgi:hypothetical protein